MYLFSPKDFLKTENLSKAIHASLIDVMKMKLKPIVC